MANPGESGLREREFSGRMMGSDYALALVGGGEEESSRWAAEARAAGDRLEALCSRFRPESPLSRLNAAKEISGEPELAALVALARSLSAETGGAFNPLVQVSRFGYDRDAQLVVGGEHAGEAGGYSASWDEVRADEASGAIAIGPTQALDFGAFLKGYAAERIARAAVAAGASGAVANVGGDCFGVGRDAAGAPFSVAIFDPIAGEDRFVVSADGQGVATSGSYRRRWSWNGSPFWHVLAPDGKDATRAGVVSATVAHPDGARADAYATAAMVLGLERGAALLARLGATDFVLVDSGGKVARAKTAP